MFENSLGQVLPLRGKLVAPSFTLQNDFAGLSGDLNFQLADWFARMKVDYLSFGRYRISNEHWRRKIPVLAEKDCTGTRHIHRHQGVQQSSGQTSLDNQLPKLGPSGKSLIKMQRIIVARKLSVDSNMVRRQSDSSFGLLAQNKVQLPALWSLTKKPVTVTGFYYLCL